MKLILIMGVWHIGWERLNCGQQVRIQGTDVHGRTFWFYGRFEIAGQNNPVFYTTFGRFTPDLAETIFDVC